MFKRIDRTVAVLSAASILCNAAIWAVLIWKIPYTQNTIFLHYNVFFGVDLTGSWGKIFVAPASGLGIWVINTIPVLFASQMTRVAKIAISILTLLLEVMLFVGAVLTILLNTA